MEGNQGGTPNPLNPNPGVGNNSGSSDLVSNFLAQMNGNSSAPTDTGNSSMQAEAPSEAEQTLTPTHTAPAPKPAPRPAPARPAPAARPASRTMPRPAPAPAPARPATATRPTMVTRQPQSAMPPVVVQPATNAPQPAVTEVDPNKKQKRKRRLIIAGIIAIVVAVICGVAAALLLINRKPEDAVGHAIDKLLSGVNNNVAINGTIEAKSNDPSSTFSKMKVDLDVKLVGGTAINATNATLTLTTRGSREDVAIELSEVYAKGGDLYVKADGLADAIMSINEAALYTNEVIDDCIVEDGEEGCTVEVIDKCGGETDKCGTGQVTSMSFLEDFAGIADLIDGEWIRISGDELGALTEEVDGSESLGCIATFAEDISSSMNSVAMLYQNNPFVMSASENLTVAKKANPIYQLSIDNTNLNSFIKGAQDLSATENLFDCMGYVNSGTNVDSFTSDLSFLPTFYVEVDNNYNFTRLYFDYKNEDADVTVDLDFAYPDNLNIVEPVEYQDLETLMQNYALDDLTTETDIPTEVETIND